MMVLILFFISSQSINSEYLGAFHIWVIVMEEDEAFKFVFKIVSWHLRG